MRIIKCIMVMALITGNAVAGEKEDQLYNEHVIRCMGVPNLEIMSQVAAAMKLPVVQEEGATKPEGYYAHMRSWLLAGDSKGPFMWGVTEAYGPNGFIADCAMSGFAVDLRALQQKIGLGAPDSTETDGPMTIMNWADAKEPMKNYRIVHGQLPGQSQPMTMFSVAYKFPEKPKR